MLNKRKRFVLTSFFLTLGFFLMFFIPDDFRFYTILALSLLTVILFYFCLYEGLGLNMTLATLVLPFFFTIGVGFFWFLLPSNIFTRIPVLLFYALGIYALSLTMNIYTVSAIRTIALFRAAKGVGFVLTLFTSFLIYDTILSLRLELPLLFLLVSLPTFFLFFQGFWSVLLTKEFSKDVLTLTLISTLILGEIGMSLFFWPVTVVVGSLFLTTAMYILLGLGQAWLENRFFAQTVREYLLVGILVFLGMLMTTSWGL